MSVKLMLVDDHPMLRHGLLRAVAQEPNFTVVAEASTAKQALELAKETTPDVVVMDIHLPDMNGIETTRQMVSVLPAIKVVIFSSDAARARIDEALLAGVRGYLSKCSAVTELIRAIGLVMEGHLYLSPEVSAGVLEDYRKSLAEPEPIKPFLSEREQQLLRLLAEGRRNKEIANHLACSTKSIEAYRSRLMKKLDCSSSAELVRYAIREGIAPL
jgi:DNA-binding NarL/FixJ family response regulator